MVANKHITKIIIAVMAAAVALCLLAIAFSGKLTELFGGTGVRMEYESKLFDTDELISIDIQMDEASWNEMLANAMSEEYYVCDVVINGERVNNVAVRPKGNTSLSAIAMDAESDRYSLKLEFDHFVDGQTCFGLDKLILNNNYADATNMKEAIIYDMYQYLGADASLYNYAEVSVNGEYWGVYLALEAVEQSFMLRSFGTQDGKLYKPDSMEMGGGEKPASDTSAPSMGDMNFSDFAGKMPPSGGFQFGGRGSDEGDTAQDGENTRPSFGDFSGENFNFDPESIPRGEDFSLDPNSLPESFDGGGMPDIGGFSPSDRDGFSMGGSGANLNYTDDDLDSYSTIWEGEVTKTGKKDHRRVVTALKNISEGNNLEKYLDVDNVLKYMAVHTFAVNMDSLSGSMAHNYYLYEYKGRLNIFPWDYNLSFGGMFSSGDATSMVNDAIDTPFSGTKFFDALLENEEYLERYHVYLQQLVDEYVNGGRFDEVYSRIRSQIDGLTEEDPNASYTYEEYETAVGILYEVVKLRAESIDGQLSGTIPSTDAGQKQDSSSLIDASHIDVEAMGQFDMGGGGGGFVGFGRGGRRSENTSEGTDSEEANSAQAVPGSGQMPNGFDPNSLPEGPDVENMPDMSGFRPGNMPSMGGSSQKDNISSGSGDSSVNSEASPSDVGENRQASFSGMPGQSSNRREINNLLIYGSCLAAMLAALVAVDFFARRKQR